MLPFMMRRKHRIRLTLISAIIMLSFNWGRTQYSPKMKFNYITDQQGLMSNRVIGVLRDSKDYLWIGTEMGLNKYDGSELKSYFPDDDDPNSLSAKWVKFIIEDRKNRIWIGTSDGLNLYDPDTDLFTVYRNDPADSTSIAGNCLFTALIDKNGSFWFITGGGCLNRWDPENENFERYRYDSFNEPIVPPTNLMAEDSKGIIWILSNTNKIYRFNPESREFLSITDIHIELGDNFNKCLYIDKQDKLWIASYGFGFFSYDPGTGETQEYPSNGGGKGTSANTIWNILPEDDRYLLLAVDHGGIDRFDKVTETFEYITSTSGNHGLNNNSIWTLYIDKEGILWVTTATGGINYNNPKQNKFKLFSHIEGHPNTLSNNSVTSFYEDSEGMIWIGTDGGGVNIFNPRTGDFKVMKNDPSDPYSLSGDFVMGVLEDEDKDIWIGTWANGVNKYDRSTGKFTHYMPKENSTTSISGHDIWHLNSDRHDNIWCGITSVGVDVIDKNGEVIKRFSANDKFPGLEFLRLLTRDKQQDMWLCTINGLYRYDEQLDSLVYYSAFNGKDVISFYEDSKGQLWAGTSLHGLYLFTREGEIIKQYGIKQGLPNNTIQAIVEDDQGHLWVSTNQGISRFNPETGKFRNYSVIDGLQGYQFTGHAFLKSRSGEIYFGGNYGFNSFQPGEIVDNEYKVPVYINDFQVFNKTVSFNDPGSPLTKPIGETREIRLSWRQSVFSFGFSSIDYTFPENNRYKYFMEGFDIDTIETNAQRRYATYTNLDPGTYNFHVWASNNDGIWSPEGASVKIVIIPPWYKTLIARILFIVFAIALIISFYLYRVSSLKRQQIYLEKLVKERTEELESLNEQLVEKQQLIIKQSEELKESNNQLSLLNATKDKLLSIIGHDLRNPFNVVIGFSELLLERANELPKETMLQYAGHIHTASKKGQDLLENLLNWSRAQTGRLKYNPALINLAQITQDTVAFVEGSAQKKKITLQQEIDSAISAEADENMLKTVLRNLVTNAIKFTPEGGKITISSSRKDDHIEVSVRDTGVGIPQDRLNKLFSIDTNVSTPGTADETGTGLGLVLCKEFIKKHGGEIRVESEPGKGSSFIFSLPAGK